MTHEQINEAMAQDEGAYEAIPPRPPILRANLGNGYWTWLWRPEGYSRWHHTDSGWESWMIDEIAEDASDPEAVEIWKTERALHLRRKSQLPQDGTAYEHFFHPLRKP